MKKLLSLMAAGLLVFSLAACGGETVTENEAENEVQVEVVPEVAEFVELAKAEGEAAGTNETTECKMSARGDAVVYTFTLLTVDNVKTEEKDALDENLAANEETVLGSLEQMQAEVPEVGAIIFEYFESDGELVTSYEYRN